jgi:hypothetical protein
VARGARFFVAGLINAPNRPALKRRFALFLPR